MNRLEKKLEVVVYWAVILYLLDTLFLGSGEIIKQLGFSSRMIFFAVAVLGSIPHCVLNLKAYLKNKYVIMIVIFALIVGINLVRGILLQNNISLMISDVRGFLNYLIIIPMLYVFNNKEKVMRCLKIFIHSATAVSLGALILSFYAKFPKPIRMALYTFLNEYVICGMSQISKDVFRIFFHTAGRWFFVAFMFALALTIIEKEKKYLWIVEMSLLITGVFVSFTRSSYLGVAIGVLLFIILICIYYREYIMSLVKHCVLMTTITVSLLLAVGLVLNNNMFEVAFKRCLLAIADPSLIGMDESEEPEDEVEVESLKIRDIRTQMAKENIAKAPVWGGGLGVENDPLGRIIEYFYLDLWTKVGIVGVLAFLLPYMYHLYDTIKKRKQYGKEQKLLTICSNIALVYLLVISYFNPCMNSTVGLSMYSLVIAMSTKWEETIQDVNYTKEA